MVGYFFIPYLHCKYFYTILFFQLACFFLGVTSDIVFPYKIERRGINEEPAMRNLIIDGAAGGETKYVTTPLFLC
jgi:hypothetical protein